MMIKIDDHIRLQFLDAADAESLFDVVHANRDHLRVWLPWVDSMQEPADMRNYILLCKKEFEAGTDFGFAIMYREKIAGRIGIHHINRHNRIGEIGYWLAGGLQGKGIITRCCTALIRFGFTEIGLNRIVIKCGVGNKRSMAIPEKLNFKREGIVRQGEWLNGKFIDLYQYSLLKEEWAGA
ncbi:MAG TPA: GNAT family protein [Ferruginibacter sp.]|nr:GNAT family protein [Ferruginibacter sp.]